ncbi:MAG: putative metal-dependent hydrolase YcfH [Alphaproteobacteria bacterium MarineAlpha9_Bin4]|nr:MAG: putative metal-dependent hydrolase YcfH [Alphaproteobacteria bacterium MarineAlpha9_Bin4]
MLIDSHCHLNMSEFVNDLDTVLSNASRCDINGLLTICTELSELHELKQLSKKYENIWYSGGIHPNNIKKFYSNELDKIFHFSSDPSFIGIGETGLDYFYDNPKVEMQKDSFIKHIEISRKLDLPVIVHTRDADADTISILKSEYEKGAFKGVIHCFTASEELAMEALKINFYISVSGIITFKNAEMIRNTIKKVPMNRLLIETDAPYLAPVPNRGKRNEPAFVKDTAKFLAQLKNISFNDLAKQTTNNFYNLFSKVKN